MQYTVTAYVNVAESNWGGRGRFRGLEPTDPIAEVDTFTIEASTPMHAAEEMFVVGQKEIRNDAAGKSYPLDVNSLSTGDLVKVVGPDGGMSFWAVACVGWREIREPTNPIVPLAGTDATSRR